MGERDEWSILASPMGSLSTVSAKVWADALILNKGKTDLEEIERKAVNPVS